MYDVLNEFSLNFIYNGIMFTSTVKKIDSFGEIYFRVEFINSFDNTKGTISHLKIEYQSDFNNCTCSCIDFVDKNLCQIIGGRIKDYYFGKIILNL